MGGHHRRRSRSASSGSSPERGRGGSDRAHKSERREMSGAASHPRPSSNPRPASSASAAERALSGVVGARKGGGGGGGCVRGGPGGLGGGGGGERGRSNEVRGPRGGEPLRNMEQRDWDRRGGGGPESMDRRGHHAPPREMDGGYRGDNGSGYGRGPPPGYGGGEGPMRRDPYGNRRGEGGGYGGYGDDRRRDDGYRGRDDGYRGRDDGYRGRDDGYRGGSSSVLPPPLPYMLAPIALAPHSSVMGEPDVGGGYDGRSRAVPIRANSSIDNPRDGERERDRSHGGGAGSWGERAGGPRSWERGSDRPAPRNRGERGDDRGGPPREPYGGRDWEPSGQWRGDGAAAPWGGERPLMPLMGGGALKRQREEAAWTAHASAHAGWGGGGPPMGHGSNSTAGPTQQLSSGCTYCGPMHDVLVIAPGLSLPPMSAPLMMKAVQMYSILQLMSDEGLSHDDACVRVTGKRPKATEAQGGGGGGGGGGVQPRVRSVAAARAEVEEETGSLLGDGDGDGDDLGLQGDY